MPELARLLDPDLLDDAPGARGRMTVEVPAAWLRAGDTIALVVPTRLECGRCDGGGCDACGRSGALRLALDEAARTIRLTLPRAEHTHARVRLVRPLGDGAGLDQLSVELRAASEPSPLCRRIEAGRASMRGLTAPAVAAAVVVLAVVIAILSAR